jgi:hypothetical protein
MTRIFIMILMVAFSCCQVLAQTKSYTPKDLIADAQKNRTTKKVDFFSLDIDRSTKVPQEVVNYDLLKFDKNKVSQLLEKPSNELLEISIPSSTRSDFKLQLVEVSIHSADSYVTTLPDNKTVKVNQGKHFRGVVKGNSKSIVAISVFADEVMGFISEAGKPNLVLGKLKDSNTHIIYEDSDLKDKLGFTCDTAESDFEYSDSDLKENNDSRALTDCVRMYIEVDHDIYQDKGSNVTTVTNFTTGLFNQIATMYANEQINIVLSPLTIWTEPSPYNSTSSSGMLNAFLANTGAFDGDLAQLISYKASGGIAYVDGLCSANPDYSKSFSSINSTYQNVPTYSWSVMVMTHEFGHLFGSQHTHACAWNGNNTAIDGCYTTEGGCPDPGNPSGGGTVMSYCHLTSVGINLNLGFGPQPGNLIRNRVSNASCTQACEDGGPTCFDGIQNGNETGIDCGGPDCTACPANCTDTEAVLTLILDNYPGETTWTLSDAGGSILYSGGPYSSAGSTVNETFCLVDGCYDFTINDTYGDGICCSYGEGSYDISIAGQSVASGGQFSSTETVNFCAGSGPTPTCDDGVQNGSETGVDCGGPDCPACETCNDGVQNNGETGVDCGGQNCPACVTCDDGVQNGNETGVDCGGPDCDPCSVPPTCTDGVQNGNETGVDCGGPDCPACESCNDGIQNNGETGVDCGGQNCPECATCDDGVQNGNETGVDCGGPDCAACPTGCNDTEAVLTLILDNYPGETTWTLTDAGGAILYSGGPYNTPGSTVNETFCLVEGCYDFTINDTYGDGICCSYGQGSYDISIAGQSLVSGGQFNSTETINFCAGSGPTPTCNDGIQNGDETGIDCGGPDCDPCSVPPTCTDGIQNGNETGVDCGGSDCDPCSVPPTCDDGAQNGNETGIDCGGPDCDACETCEDGIQNGDETGIDCGGPDCVACNDGGDTDIVFAHYFESGWDGWEDGGSDCYRYTGPRSYEGAYSIRLRDNSGTASAMTSSAYDLSSYSSVELTFYFFPNSMEYGEDFWLRYYDGNTWQTVATFTSGINFQNNSFYVATVPILSSDYNMASNAKFRLQCDASANADRVYIDAVSVTGLGGNSLVDGETKINKLRTIASIDQYEIMEDLSLAPNPAQDLINLRVNLDYTQSLRIEIIDILGKQIMAMSHNAQEGNNIIPINILNINTGTYLIKVTDNEGDQMGGRFIKIR